MNSYYAWELFIYIPLKNVFMLGGVPANIFTVEIGLILTV